MRTLVTPDTDFLLTFHEIDCNQHAFSAIYQNYFWKLAFIADAILLQI